jgi:hypothetical protein
VEAFLHEDAAFDLLALVRGQAAEQVLNQPLLVLDPRAQRRPVLLLDNDAEPPLVTPPRIQMRAKSL